MIEGKSLEEDPGRESFGEGGMGRELSVRFDSFTYG